MLLYKEYFKPYTPQFYVAIFFLAIESLADLYQPLLISRLIDKGIANKDLIAVRNIGLMMLGVACIGLLSALMRNYMSTHVSYSFGRDLREGLFHKVLKLNMTEVEEIERGSLINRLTFDVQQIQHFVNGTMRIFLKAPMLAFGSFIMVLQLDNRFFYIYLGVVPIVVTIVLINVKIGFPLFAKIQVQLDRLNKKTIEYLNGIRVVKAFNRASYENKNFEKVNRELMGVSSHAMKVMAIFNPINMLVINMAVLGVLFVSREWMVNSTFGVGQIVAFVNYMTQLLFAVSIMSRIFIMFNKAKTSNIRIVEILEAQKEDEYVANFDGSKIQAKDFYKGLSVQNLSYRFGQGEYALRDINFELAYGESIGIIGGTGAGKTTLANLLTGILIPTEGKITIGDKALSKANMASYREHLAYVPQDKILFSASVIDNIKHGNKDLSDQVCKDIIEQSASEFIYDMEHGLDTKLGKGGVNISGGQKQRLSLARALARQGRLLILDDSTSALDSVTEKRIFDYIANKSNKESLIVIGQKISTLRRMDRIIVLHNGQLVGIGNHESLLEECESYQELHRVQMGVSN